MGEVQPDAPGTLVRLEVARNRIRDHNIQFSERIALGRDTTPTGGIPARHITAGSRARFNVEDDFNIIAHNRMNKQSSGHGQWLSCFFKLRRRHRLGAFSQRFTNPFLEPQRRRLKSGSELWQADAESLPDDIGFA